MTFNLECDPRSISRAIVNRFTGLEAGEAEPIEGRGMSAKVFVVGTSEGRFVVRLKNADWLPNFKKEAWCLERAHQNGIPVPRAVDCGIESNYAYSVVHFLEGTQPIHCGFDRLGIWETLGRYARILNGIPVHGFGPTMISDGKFSIPFNREMIEPELQIIFRDELWERRGGVSARQVAETKKLLESCCDIEGQVGICQWDMCCENALIRGDDSSNVVLLDLDQAVAVLVPQHQLAYVAKGWGLETEIMKSFVRGYGMSSAEFEEALPIVKRLLVLQSMRSVRWAEDRNPAWLDRNIEKAQADITKLLKEERG